MNGLPAVARGRDRVTTSMTTRRLVEPIWRVSTMTISSLRRAIRGTSLAAVLGGAVLVGGCATAAARPSSTAAPTSTASPTAMAASSSPSPSPSPSATSVAGPATMPRGELDPGTFVARPVVGDAIRWQVTVPLGWTNGHSWFLYPTSLRGPAGTGSGEPNGLAVAFLNVPEVFPDSCDFSSMSDTGTVAELIAAMQAKDDWVVSTPVDVTIGGFSGQRVDVALPADLSACGPGNYFVFGEPGTENGFYAQGPSQQLRVWILDVDGRIVSLVRQAFPATPAKELAEAQQIIESSVITP